MCYVGHIGGGGRKTAEVGWLVSVRGRWDTLLHPSTETYIEGGFVSVCSPRVPNHSNPLAKTPKIQA